ncbi:uncharacterized protein RCO7_06705 [Rhynchosporium graminicola]|uniref:C3H1-type domain-containing protein n=1 Tax=Rhynchosporium graminicola TaxID=2792576 RepID=A0A1E1K2R3_9HELO|nr:uncharacterized protein RCO7_06705 [Rhynchosporium commune]
MPLNQKGKPWPAYFLVRTTGEVVPLIAVDELPPGTDVIGVPRFLDLEETVGMLNLGLQRSSGAFYQIVDDGGNVKVEGVEGDDKASEDPSSSVSERTLPQSSATATGTPPPMAPNASPTQISRGQARANPTTTNTLARPTQNHVSPNPHPQTQLCRHWCHHGICKWGQKCRYHHIMPMSTSGLSEVGLSDWPLWFRRMNPGYFAAQNANLNGVVNAGRVAGGARGRRGARSAGCTHGGGSGGACCGVLHGAGAGAGRERGRGERPLGVPREKAGGRVFKSEELGEKIIARLKGMTKKHAVKEKVVEKASERLSNASLVERAAARETREWEDENDEGGPASEDDVNETEVVSLVKGKLVDI